MKKLLLAIMTVGVTFGISAQTLTSGNILVFRAGDSVATLSNTGNVITLDQFTTSGTYVNSIYLPRTGTNALSTNGTATSEGQLNLSSDASSVNLFCYKVAAPHTSSLNGSASSLINRAVVSVNANGTISTPTLTSQSYSAGNPRGVFSDGTGYWGYGSNTGITYGTTSTNIDLVVTSSSVNIRSAGIFANRIFYTTGSGTVGLWRMTSANVPTTTGNTASVYITTAGTGTGTASPYGFAFNPDTTICYITDDRTIANGGGIQKWVRTGSTWSLAYTLGTGSSSTVGARGIAVNWSTSNPILIVTTAETSANRIISISDQGASSVATVLATAGTNTVYRGVAFTPNTNTLPVQFKSFTARKNSDVVNLKWATASESNNKGFEVQRSINGAKYQTVGFVRGNGNSNVVKTYSFTDAHGSTGNICYRLKQIDFNGASEFSKVACVNVELEKTTAVFTTPNPFSGSLHLKYNSVTEGAANVQIIDMLGKTHQNVNMNVIKGENTLTLDTEVLPVGIYFIRVTNGAEVTTQRIVKK